MLIGIIRGGFVGKALKLLECVNLDILVPGHDNKFVFGGTCLVKDINNLKYDIELNKTNCLILENVIKRNERIDRCEKDWMLNKGRYVI